MTYSVFRCTISEVKFTLTSRDLLIHRPFAVVFTLSLYVSSDRALNILIRALLHVGTV